MLTSPMRTSLHEFPESPLEYFDSCTHRRVALNVFLATRLWSRSRKQCLRPDRRNPCKGSCAAIPLHSAPKGMGNHSLKE